MTGKMGPNCLPIAVRCQSPAGKTRNIVVDSIVVDSKIDGAWEERALQSRCAGRHQ